MMLRTGFALDEHGRPTHSLTRDEGPGRARPGRAATSTPAFRGTLVVGDHGHVENSRQQTYAARRAARGVK